MAWISSEHICICATFLHAEAVISSWEYPGNQGIGCNIVNANDSANFLELLKEIRASPHLAQGLTLTAATAIRPFIGIDGNSVRSNSWHNSSHAQFPLL